jgi:twitching motility protein PilJ
VLSQQLANQGRDAVGGNAQAFTAFKATRNAIEQNVSTCRALRQGAGRVRCHRHAGRNLGAAGQAGRAAGASEPAVLALAGNANNFTGAVPGLQAQLNELVRAMSASGAPSAQVYSALQQVVVAGSMARRVTEMRAGGSAAATSGDALAATSPCSRRCSTACATATRNWASPPCAVPPPAALEQSQQKWKR